MTEQTVWRVAEQKGPSGLKRLQESIPSPKAKQYLVRVHAVSLNFRDVAILNGTYGLGVKDNIVLGADMGGEIIEVGEGATKFKKGDRVTSLFNQTHFYGVPTESVTLGGEVDGVLLEYRLFDEITLLRVPDYLSYEEISCFPIAAVTAWNSLYGNNPLIPGQTALFQGTGGVSVFGLQIAQATGAKTIVTSSSDEKLEIAKKLGATHVINYRKTPDWDKEVKRLTNGVGAHHIFDNVGLNEIERCFGAVARGGTISNIGFLGGQSKASPNTPMLTLRTSSIMRGILVGSKQQFEELLRFAEFNKLKPHIDKVFPFDRTVEAVEYLQGAQHFGKVVIRVVGN